MGAAPTAAPMTRVWAATQPDEVSKWSSEVIR